MALEFGYTPGNNKYPLTDSDYVQAAFWKSVAESRDTLDSELLITALGHSKNFTDRGTLPADHDYFTDIASGIWYTGGVDNMSGQLNKPGGGTARPGTILVFSAPGTPARSQIHIPYQTPLEFWVTSVTSATSPTAWMAWVNLAGAAGSASTLPPDHDYATYLDPGEYYSGGTTNMSTQTNKPGGDIRVPRPGRLIVYGDDSNVGRYQTFTPYQIPVEYWVSTNLSTSGGFSPFVDATAAPTYGAGTPNEMRIQAFKDAYPLVSTANKGVVVFRYDHGLTNLKSTLLAMHQTAGIPFYVAMNSRNWGEAQNSGATQADVKSWIANDGCEMGNHTADHRDKNTAAGIQDNIVNGRKELESQLGVKIHGFTVPGLSEYNQFEGFGGGTLDSYSDTLAGALILANHAISSGGIGPTQRILDGTIRQGGRHYTWEAQGFATIQAQIDSAITNKTALTLFAHPSVMGDAGKFDAVLAQQVIDYVKTKIDAGELANISYYQSHHATL